MDENTEMQKDFFIYLKKLLSLFKGKNTENIDEVLADQSDSKLEKQLIVEMCEEVDAYHVNMKELKVSGKNAGEWLEEEVEKLVKEVKSDATSDDIKIVKEALGKAIDKDIEENFKGYIEEEAVPEEHEENGDPMIQKKEDRK